MRGQAGSVPGDPHRITTRYPGECHECGVAIPKGSRAWFWPKGKFLKCLDANGCGERDEARFHAEVEDEIMSGGWS